MANITFEECLRKAVDNEIERLMREAIHELEERLKRQVPEIIAKLSLSIMERVSIRNDGRDVIIHAEWKDGK